MKKAEEDIKGGRKRMFERGEIRWHGVKSKQFMITVKEFIFQFGLFSIFRKGEFQSFRDAQTFLALSHKLKH